MLKFIWKPLLLFCFAVVLPLPAAEASPYAKSSPVVLRSAADKALGADWRRKKLPVPAEAADAVLVRRLYLGLAGRLPTPEEARAYLASNDPDKYEALADRLLDSDDFAEYWTMYWCDALRVKSEFPINLWPNAVYGYRRRIRRFLAENEPYPHFVRSLLTAEGSNFRVPEVNFARAAADRSPAGLAKETLLTFLGIRFETLPESEQAGWTALFKPVRFKSSREWKEEIVYWERPASGPDPRAAAADAVLSHPDFARAAVNRVWGRLFGRGIVPEPDDLRSQEPVNPELLKRLAAGFTASGGDYRKLCREIVLSAAYRAAPFAGDEAAERNFASFPVRRLDAEVLDDAIRDLSGAPGSYSSVIPEPFTFLPPGMRATAIADGSITSSFLILFGRPARDSGRFSERNNDITAKQRLWLFNSGELYRRLGRIPAREELRKLPLPRKVEELYWLFYSRPPSQEEARAVRQAFDRLPKGKEQWRFPQDLCWVLLNSKEFLYQH